MKHLLVAVVLALLLVACRGIQEADSERDPGDGAEATGEAADLYDDVYRRFATLRLLVEDGPAEPRVRQDNRRYAEECHDSPAGCNLEAFRFFYDNFAEGPSLAYERAEDACDEALEQVGAEKPDRAAALRLACAELPDLVQESTLFALDIAALDAAIATLAAAAN